MEFTTSFFNCFGSVLFGKPAVSDLNQAFAKLSQRKSFTELRRLFGCYFPAALLAPTASGENSRDRIFSLDVVFWAFLDQVQTPLGSCREAVRKVMAYMRRKSPDAKCGTMSPDSPAYCAARARISVATGTIHNHETLLFQSLWHTLEKGDLIVADRGYCSFGAVANLLNRGVDTLMRVPLKKIRKALTAKLPNAESFDVIVTWERPSQCIPSMTPEAFADLPESISVRVIRYPIVHAGFRTRSVTLVTTVLDPKIKSIEFADLYLRRWGIEVHFRELKISLHMDVLRCLTPHMIERELRMHFVAYNLIRCVMQKAAITHDVDLSRASFKGCLDTVRQFANAMQGAEVKPRVIAAMIDEMLLAIARDLNPLRPGRSEPRAVKRRPKSYNVLNKPRGEMGNLPHHNKGAVKHPEQALS